MTRLPWRSAGFGLAVALSAVACGSDDKDAGSVEGSTGASDTSDGGAGTSGVSAGGSSGAATTGAGAGAATFNPGSCLPVLGKCSADTLPCCGGTECVGGQCRQPCSDHGECGSKCCADSPEAGKKLCSSIAQCPQLLCLNEATECATSDKPCCGGLICVAADQASWAGCRQECSADGDCSSGCCVPFANVSGGFCADARFCACATLDETCGGTTRCCSGLACSTYDATGTFGCRPLCSNNGECDTKCCKQIVGTQDSVCVDTSFCSP